MNLANNPIHQFELWLEEVKKNPSIKYPNAMTVSTIRQDGYPDARILLLKGIEDGRFLFFTNYQSHKAQQMAESNKVGLTFFWESMGHQVRILGTVEKVSHAESEAYFQTRPRLSQIGALASNQSQIVESRDELEQRVKEVEAQYPAPMTIPCPSHWGGYALTPHEIEFWIERPFRLHDRFKYTRQPDHTWTQVRLNP